MLYVGERSEREQCHLLSSLLAFSHFLCHSQVNWALLVLIPCGWVCAHSRTLWVSPAAFLCGCNFLQLLPQPPQVFPVRDLRLYFPALEPWVGRSVLLSRCSSLFIHMQMWDCPLCQHLPTPVLQQPPWHQSSPPELLISTPPTGLNECFFFNSLVVRLPYSSIFWQFWVFFFFKFVVVLFLVV